MKASDSRWVGDGASGWTNEDRGGDGIYPAELRLIDAAKPVLTASTATVVIDVASGTLGMAGCVQLLDEPWDEQEIEGTVCLNVPPGRYKACAFGFATSRSVSMIAVVTATSDELHDEPRSLDKPFG